MSANSLYDDLGVGKDASPEDVKRAFKRRARKTHPDAGGSTEEFQRVNHAYQVLSSPPRRQQYDRTGHDGHVVDEAAVRLNNIMGLIMQIIANAEDVDSFDVIGNARRHIEAAIAGLEANIKQHQRSANKIERAARRLKRKDGGDNKMAEMLKFQAAKVEEVVASLRAQIDDAHKSLEFLKDYNYEAEMPKTTMFYVSSA